MAYDPKPSTWFGAGYTVDTENHKVGLNTNEAASNKLVTELTDTEADPTTGDVRKVIFALMEMLYAAWAAVDPADRPSRVTMHKSSQATGGVLTHTYTVVTVNEITGQKVADEPEE